MDIEQNSLQERARRHAALGDPARLRIADLLSASDRSSAEVQAELGISSSLLAHHLGVLEGAGLIARHRSEGDRRRSYLRLREISGDSFGPKAALAARRVVFVCTGNSARSQLAAALWREQSDVPSASAGTHPARAVASGARDAARRRGLPELAARPQDLADVLRVDDLIVTVCDVAREDLGDHVAVHWSVPDPVPTGTAAAFDAAVDELAERIGALTHRINAA